MWGKICNMPQTEIVHTCMQQFHLTYNSSVELLPKYVPPQNMQPEKLSFNLMVVTSARGNFIRIQKREDQTTICQFLIRNKSKLSCSYRGWVANISGWRSTIPNFSSSRGMRVSSHTWRPFLCGGLYANFLVVIIGKSCRRDTSSATNKISHWDISCRSLVLYNLEGRHYSATNNLTNHQNISLVIQGVFTRSDTVPIRVPLKV